MYITPSSIRVNRVLVFGVKDFKSREEALRIPNPNRFDKISTLITIVEVLEK